MYSRIQTFLYQIFRQVEDTSGFGARGRRQRHFACFTGTQVQILTPEELRQAAEGEASVEQAGITCFTGTQVHILTPEELRQAAEGEASVEQAGITGLPSSDVQAMHNEVIFENLRAHVC
jgi:hypothetical protein